MKGRRGGGGTGQWGLYRGVDLHTIAAHYGEGGGAGASRRCWGPAPL